MTRRFALLAALVLLAAVPFSGCSRRTTLRPNVPPETTVFVQGAVSAVNHRVHLYWYGSDPDGEVVAYQYRFLNSANAADSQWVRVDCGAGINCTDAIFTLYSPNGITMPTFEVRAIDNTGAIDPTPASENFTFTNNAPIVTLTTRPLAKDTTYASVTVTWAISDPDGDLTKVRYHVWLDGNRSSYDSTLATTFTVPSSRFLQGVPGTYASGRRTLYVEAIDDGGRVGPVDSCNWFVQAPAPMLTAQKKGRVLIVDEVPHNGNSNFNIDSLYLNPIERALRYQYSVLRTEFNPNIFRSAQDVAQTFRQFDAVVWYRGVELTISPTLQAYQDSIVAYVQNGGNLYLEGLYLIAGENSIGSLRSDFVTSALNSSGMYKAFRPSTSDSSVGWGNNSASTYRSSMFEDSLRNSITFPVLSNTGPGIRAFVPRDTSQVALWARIGAISSNAIELPVSMYVRPPGVGGRVFIVTFPLRATSPTAAGARFLSKVLFHPALGMLSP